VTEIYNSMPVIALRGIVVFPDMNLHFEIGRAKSVKAVDVAMENGQEIMLITQKNIGAEDPTFDELFETGVIAKIEQVIKVRGRSVIRACVQGISRAKVIRDCRNKDYLEADVVTVENDCSFETDEVYVKGLVHTLKEYYEEYISLSDKMARDVLLSVIDCNDPASLADLIASNALEDIESRQRILDELNPVYRAQKLLVCSESLLSLPWSRTILTARFRKEWIRRRRNTICVKKCVLFPTSLTKAEKTRRTNTEKKYFPFVFPKRLKKSS